MRFFTPELYLGLQDFSSDDAMDGAERAWERARVRYRRHLNKVLSSLPTAVSRLLENYYLHDAELLSMGERGRIFVLVLRLDVPPRELLILNYRLNTEPNIRKDVLPARAEHGPITWMYDEVGLARGKNLGVTHDILFSNGWEVRLRLKNLEIVQTQALYPDQRTVLVPVQAAVPQPA